MQNAVVLTGFSNGMWVPSMASSSSGGAETSCCTPHRNSFDLVPDTARTLEAENASVQRSQALATAHAQPAFTDERSFVGGKGRLFEHEHASRFSGYTDVELTELSGL